MKTSFRVKVLSLVMSFTLLAAVVQAAEYYVVIGAFSNESNARRFTNTVRTMFFKDVSYSFNESKKLYYVHVLKTSHKEDARNWSFYLRNEKGFKDAWVLTHAESDPYTISSDSNAKHVPRYENQLELAANNQTVASSVASDKNASYGSVGISSAEKINTAWTMNGGVGFIKNVQNINAFKNAQGAEAANLFTFIVEDNKGKVIPAEVLLVNFEQVKKIATFQTGENVAIKGTKREQVVTFVCDMLGFSQETRMLNVDHLSRSKGIRKNENGIWEVRIKLKKMDVNDVYFMNKTTFHKDAAVLEASSKKEMDELVHWMKSNPGYRIIIHSHCNPGTKRSVVMPVRDNNYFDMKATVEKSGSDKLLTKKRAEIVKNYLIDNGIDKKRIGMVAWGSMEMIVSTTSKEASINDRIEIELAGV